LAVAAEQVKHWVGTGSGGVEWVWSFSRGSEAFDGRKRNFYFGRLSPVVSHAEVKTERDD
jgi:hypothetical protein